MEPAVRTRGKYILGECNPREPVRDSWRGPAEEGEPVPECAIKLGPASGYWLLHSVRPPEEHYVTLFSILCWRPERGAFISGLSSPIDHRFTTGRLISRAPFWILVYPETLTKKSVGGRRDVREA